MNTTKLCPVCGSNNVSKGRTHCSPRCRGVSMRTIAPTDCGQCGKPCPKRGAKFCSRACMAVSYSDRTERQCATCGLVFVDRVAGTRRFCSIPCKNIGISRKVDCTCRGCGAQFKMSAYRIGRGAGKYCTRKCRDEHWRINPSANSHWKQGVSPEREGPTTARWKTTVKDRAGNACEDCGVTDCTITAHHLYPWRDWPEIRQHPENGRALCIPCHKKTYRKEYTYLTRLGLPVVPPREWFH